MYDSGQGVPKDTLVAIEWYEKAAAQGDSNALLNLGAIYATGDGVLTDYTKAIEYYKKSADFGNYLALENLAIMHFSAQGTAQDLIAAYTYIMLSQNINESEQGQQLMKEILSRLSPESINIAKEQANELWETIQKNSAIIR